MASGASSNEGYRQGPVEKASIEVFNAMQEISEVHRFCSAKSGSYAYKYDYVKYIWELKARLYTSLSKQIISDLPAVRSTDIRKNWEIMKNDILSARNGVNNNNNGKYCAKYFSSLLTGSTHKLTAPKKALSPLLGPNEKARVLVRNLGMEVGCVKQGYNNDIKDFSSIKVACECQTSLLTKQMSSEGIDKYLALVANKKQKEAIQFISSTVNIPELQACYSY